MLTLEHKEWSRIQGIWLQVVANRHPSTFNSGRYARQSRINSVQYDESRRELRFSSVPNSFVLRIDCVACFCRNSTTRRVTPILTFVVEFIILQKNGKLFKKASPLTLLQVNHSLIALTLDQEYVLL